MAKGFLLPEEPVTTLDEYLTQGGGEGLRRAEGMGPEAVVAEVRSAGLRGRGGAGFPTGIKWAGLRDDPSPIRYVVCNGAEGEPGTFKDRSLMRANPYQLIEGIAVAAFALGAEAAFLGIKRSFGPELASVKRALAEMSAAGAAGPVSIGIVEGPDDYLFGEEKALLEVVEGNEPLPRLYPPYIEGLFSSPDRPNPAVVNNVETLSNVPHIIARGAEWFRSLGTEESPGTMVFTLSGDVEQEGVVELELGTPLSFLIYWVGEGIVEGRSLKAMVSGVSNRPLPASLMDTPLSFEAMKAVGSGLGSGGIIVYDETACMVRVGEVLSRFLARESCGQCPPCKLGTEAITRRFADLHSPGGRVGSLDELGAWTLRITDANRCGLGAGQRALVEGLLDGFWEEIVGHVDGPCRLDREVRVPAISDYDEVAKRFVYVE